MEAGTITEELKELKKISKILTLVNAELLDNELAKYATTDDRKKIWIMIDGETMSKDMAESIGISEDGVNKFLKILKMSGLIENPRRQAPKKLLDYVPSSWLELVDGN